MDKRTKEKLQKAVDTHYRQAPKNSQRADALRREHGGPIETTSATDTEERGWQITAEILKEELSGK